MSMPGNDIPIEEWCPECSPWLIAAAVMLPTFMEVLDTSIASRRASAYCRQPFRDHR